MAVSRFDTLSVLIAESRFYTPPTNDSSVSFGTTSNDSSVLFGRSKKMCCPVGSSACFADSSTIDSSVSFPDTSAVASSVKSIDSSVSFGPTSLRSSVTFGMSATRMC
eukprot:342561-Pyramimonas_sp.AAC.1